MQRLALAAFLVVMTCLAPAAPKAAKSWQWVDGCRWKAEGWNDGDSFHVVTGDEGREIVASLYLTAIP